MTRLQGWLAGPGVKKARNLRLRAFLFATLLINLRLSVTICTIFTLLLLGQSGMMVIVDMPAA